MHPQIRKNLDPGALQRFITSIHELRPSGHASRCEARRVELLSEELIAWLATAPCADPLQVTVVIPDETRPLSPARVLPPVLEAIDEAAQRRGAMIGVRVLVATGLHKPPGERFMEALRGALSPFTMRPQLELTWDHHDAHATEREGMALNPQVTRARNGGLADRVVLIGLVEPHQYAGFSGGTKGLTIGCGSTSTISTLHSLEMLRRSEVVIGEVERNPFRHTLDRLARLHAAPTFQICLVPSPHDRQSFAGLFVGAGSRPYKAAVRIARQQLMIPLERRFDFALVSVPESKQANFYQASRALTYLALHKQPCIRKDGMIVLMAPCPDGYGTSRGEEAFRRTLNKGRRRLLSELSGRRRPRRVPEGGAQRAYVLAQALERFNCVLVGAPPMPEAQNAGLAQYDSLEDVMLAGAGLIVDDPFVTMPYYDEEDARVDHTVQLSDLSSGSPP